MKNQPTLPASPAAGIVWPPRVDVEQHDVAGRVVVPQVVLDLLIVPAQLAGARVERDDRIGVEVVAVARRAVEIRVGIAGAEDHAGRAAASIAGVVQTVPPPRLPRIAGERLRIGRLPAPALLAGVRVVRGDETAQRPLAAGAADDHLAVVDLRRHALGVADRRIGDARLPALAHRCARRTRRSLASSVATYRLP